MNDTIKMYGTPTCDDCRRTKELFAKHKVPYEFFDITDDEVALKTLLELSNGEQRTPVLLLPNGKVLIEPTDKEMIETLGL